MQGVFKFLIGKDMIKMILLVFFNELMLFLYWNVEDMEYMDLLEFVVECMDLIEWMIYVVVFVCSEFVLVFGCVVKLFNFFFGEIFEYVWFDKGYCFFMEQVSYYFLIGVVWVEVQNWIYWGELNVKFKFIGKLFDINYLGIWFLRL